jgi:hypothetical protein
MACFVIPSRRIATSFFNAFLRLISSLNRKKFLLKMLPTVLCFYLGYQKEPWFGQPGSENACVFHLSQNLASTKYQC